MITWLLLIMLQTNSEIVVLAKETKTLEECEKLETTILANLRTVQSAQLTTSCAEVKRND